MQMKPCLCNEIDFTKVKFPAAVSPKIDGVRAMYFPGDTYLTSRDGKMIHGMSHIVRALPYGHVYDMELYVPGVEFNTASGIIRNHDETPIVKAYIFDVPSIDGDFLTRWANKPQEASSIIIANHYKVHGKTALMQLYARFLKEGYEGAVVKSIDDEYTQRRTWWRLTPSISIDVKVEKVYEGKGKMAGMAGGFYFTYNGRLCKVGTLKGLDYPARIDLWFNEQDYIGRTAIVEFKEHQPSGMPRQPRFKGWRYDK